MDRESVLPAGWPRWAALVGISAVLAIIGALVADLRWLHYVFKPLTTLLVIALVWRAPQAQPTYRRAVLAGLLLSTAGDIFLMLPQDRFVFGLASFLLAHIAYLYALTRHRGLQPWRWPFLAYALVAGLVLALLWPRLPQALQIPVLVYVIALAGMAAQAAAVATQRAHAGAMAAALGGFSFVVSDATLALDRFHTPWPGAVVLVLASYWLAQFLIGMSVWRSAR
jgi:uncharacterized membrane protein YhhN